MHADEHAFEGERGCGERLRRTREAAGLSIDEVSQRLKMPARVVQSLEAEDWSRLGAPVFIRGQLRSYSRLLGLATAPVHAAAGVEPVEPSKLTPRTYTPQAQRIAEQFARRLVYVVITAAIAVPVWLATRSHLSLPTTETAALDVASVQGVKPAHAGSTPADTAPRPLAASLTPMPAAAHRDGLSLRFRGDSWIQVIAPDGRVIEKGLLKAGEQRGYPAGDVGRVVLGNATEVDVASNGRDADLAPYLRANVARFAVSSDGSLVPAAD